MLQPKGKSMKWLSPTDKTAVKRALLKMRYQDFKKGTKEGALFKTVHKPFSPGKAGGVTRQRGGTKRGD